MMALAMCADGVTSVSSMLCVMMPARSGGVCGKPPGGAAGMVGGIVVMFTKRAPGLVSYASAERAADLRRHAEREAFVEVRGEADADAIEHLRVAAADDEALRPASTPRDARREVVLVPRVEARLVVLRAGEIEGHDLAGVRRDAVLHVLHALVEPLRPC